MEEQIQKNEQIIHDFHHRKHKRNLIIIIILSFLLICTGGVLAQYANKQILRCGAAGSNELCFDVEATPGTSGAKFGLKNIPENKKYRFILKRKINDNEVIEVGSMLVDMNQTVKIASGEQCLGHNQSSDAVKVSCCGEYQKKTDSDTPGLAVCCGKDECARDGSCLPNLTVLNNNQKCQSGSWVALTSGPNTCSDSDGGKDYLKRGMVSFFSHGSGTSFEDRCVGDYMLEYYCDGNSYREERHICSGGYCSGGVCVASNSSLCQDSDGGLNYFQKGHLNWTVQKFEDDDHCSDANTLVEYVCGVNIDGASIYEDAVPTCPNGCEDGACKCMNLGQYFNDKNAKCCTTTVSPLELKPDYYNSTSSSEIYTCCAPNQCALDGTCFDDSFVFSAEGVFCSKGKWEKLTF